MRLKAIITACGIFFLFLAILPVVRPRHTESPGPAINPPSEGPITDEVTTRSHSLTLPTDNGTVSRDAHTIQTALPRTHETDALTRAAELMHLAMNNDSASLATILRELGNPDPAIRSAALQAVIQFGSRDAIPILRQDAEQTQDAGEKAQILAAMEFLKLPSLSEMMAHSAAAGEGKAVARPGD